MGVEVLRIEQTLSADALQNLLKNWLAGRPNTRSATGYQHWTARAILMQ